MTISSTINYNQWKPLNYFNRWYSIQYIQCIFNIESSQSPTHERELIKYYFDCGYPYEVIVDFLCKHHGISIGMWTLKRRLHAYGLKKKGHVLDVGQVRDLVKVEMAHAGAQSGYRSIWHALRHIHKIHPPRKMVADILRELDPEASETRKSRRLRRRKYLSSGPNYCWHVDGRLINIFYIWYVYYGKFYKVISFISYI